MIDMIQISPINNTSYTKPSFKAVKVAKTYNMLKNFPTDIDIYKIGTEDKSFIENLDKKINISKLFPKLQSEKSARWQQVFMYCIQRVLSGENESYVAIHDNKPCGIVTYKDNRTMIVDGICSIPTEINKKVPGVGKTLFYQVFKDALEAKAEGINLNAVVDGPFDTVKMYSQIGFKEKIPMEYSGYQPMSCNKYSIPKEINKLAEYINYTAAEYEKTDLNQFLA